MYYCIIYSKKKGKNKRIKMKKIRGRPRLSNKPKRPRVETYKLLINYLSKGWSLARIGKKLGISGPSLNKYCCDLYKKHKVHSRLELVQKLSKRVFGFIVGFVLANQTFIKSEHLAVVEINFPHTIYEFNRVLYQNTEDKVVVLKIIYQDEYQKYCNKGGNNETK